MSAAQTARSSVIGVPAAALIGVAAWIVGLDGPHAIAVGAGVLAVVVVLLAQRSAVPPADLLPPDPEPPVGGRRDVEQLAWTMVEQRTRIRGVVLARVARLAADRLHEHGLDLQRAEDGAAIESLLGPAAWAVLRPGRDRPVGARELDAVLTALEHLPPPPPLGHERTARSAAQPERTSRAD